MKSKDKIKRDNFLVNLLSKHRGKEKAISSEDIINILSCNGYNIARSTLRNKISKLRQERTLPILYSVWVGYYWANTQAELKESVRDCQVRIDGTQQYINLLKKFIIE